MGARLDDVAVKRDGTSLRLVHGNLDVVETLQEALDKAKRGEVDAVCIGTYHAGKLATRWAYHEDLQHSWVLLVALAAMIHQDVMAIGE